MFDEEEIKLKTLKYKQYGTLINSIEDLIPKITHYTLDPSRRNSLKNIEKTLDIKKRRSSIAINKILENIEEESGNN